MTLEKLTIDIKKTTANANKNLDEVHPNVRAGWGAEKGAAKEKLKELMVEYKATLLTNGIAIFLDGDPAKVSEFINLVHGEVEGLVVDAAALYERLANAVEVTMTSSRNWGVDQHYKLNIALQEVMSEVGLSELPMPARDSMPITQTHADVINHLRDLIRNSCGDMLNSLYLQEAAVRDSLQICYMNVMVPVFVLNARTDERASLGSAFMRGSTTVDISSDTEVNKEFMIKTFKEVNKKLSKPTKRTKLESKQEKVNE